VTTLVFNSAVYDALRGAIDFDTDTFYCMLVDGTYTPNQDTHGKRSDVTGEIAATGGYVAGGFAATVSLARDDTNNRVEVTLGGIEVAAATITARQAVYYKRRGGAASADELVACIDFGSNVVSTNASWSLSNSLLRFALPA
jgi:hypothetical protein